MNIVPYIRPTVSFPSDTIGALQMLLAKARNINDQLIRHHLQFCTHGDLPDSSRRLALQENIVAWGGLIALLQADYRSKEFNPDQPRIPAGSPDGGQWASENDDASYVPPAEDNDEGNDATLFYSNGKPVIDPNTGQPYLMPPNMDVSKNVETADLLFELEKGGTITRMDINAYMLSQFYTGGPQDYQRPNGLLAALNGDRQMEYRDISNYNYGAVSAAAGYSLDVTLGTAGMYNRIFGNTHQQGMTSYGIPQWNVDTITQGYVDSAQWLK